MDRRLFLKGLVGVAASAAFPVALARRDETSEFIDAARRGPVRGRQFRIGRTVLFENGWDVEGCAFDYVGPVDEPVFVLEQTVNALRFTGNKIVTNNARLF